MSGKTFLDTNIVVYLYSGDEPEKQAAALALIEQNNPVVSTQVLSELANTLSRKFGLAFDVVAQAVAEVSDACLAVPVCRTPSHKRWPWRRNTDTPTTTA